MAKRDLSAEYVREHYFYEPESGKLLRTKRTNGKLLDPPERAGVKGSIGYRVVRIHPHTYSEHELIWLWMTGSHKQGHMDHIDGVRDNNKWENLRVVPQKINNQNVRSAQRNNKTGLLGVSYSQGRKKYKAQITVDGRNKCLGEFETPIEAYAAYLGAKRQYHQGCTI